MPIISTLATMLILNGLVPNPIHCVAKQMFFDGREKVG